MINKKILRYAKKASNNKYIQGELVKEDDIIWAFKNQLISGYGADVIEKEFDDIKKFNCENINRYTIIVTPHIGGMTYQGQLRAYTYAIDSLKINIVI